MQYPTYHYAYRSCCLGVPAPTLLAATKTGDFLNLEFRPRFANGYLSFHKPTSSGQQDSSGYNGRIVDLNGNTVAVIQLNVTIDGDVEFASLANPEIVDSAGRLKVRNIIELANDNVPGSGTGVLWIELDGGGEVTTMTIQWEPS